MEGLNLLLNKAEEYDAVIKNSLQDAGDLRIITKDGAMVSGRAAVMFTFTVRLPDGTTATAQVVKPVRLLMTVLAGLKGRYNEDGISRVN